MHIQLNRKLPLHDDLSDYRQRWKYWKESYKCDYQYVHGVDAVGNNIIPRFDKCERNSSYKNRLDRTVPRAHVGNIINKYNSTVFAKEITRSDLPIYSDVDGKSTSIDRIMRKATINAQICGFSFLVVETTNTGTISLLQSRTGGSRERILLVPQQAILNWEESDGFLISALISFIDENGKEFARHYASDGLVTDIYFNKNFIVTDMSEPYPSGFSSIPVVKLTFDFPWESQVSAIADLQKQIANYLSLEAQEIYNHTFSKKAIGNARTLLEAMKDLTPEQRDQYIINLGSEEMLLFEDAVTVSNIGSDVMQAESIRKSIKETEDNIYRVAGLKVSDSIDGQSGIAKLIEQEDFFVNCKTLADGCEEAENMIGRLLSEIYSSIERVYYPDTFAATDWQAEILELRDLTSLPISEEAKEVAIRNFEVNYGLTNPKQP